MKIVLTRQAICRLSTNFILTGLTQQSLLITKTCLLLTR